jgi:hypothetical protein
MENSFSRVSLKVKIVKELYFAHPPTTKTPQLNSHSYLNWANQSNQRTGPMITGTPKIPNQTKANVERVSFDFTEERYES